jgi:NosR/NirI family transcriptional regulator, nitrous oxide reductase regulator
MTELKVVQNPARPHRPGALGRIRTLLPRLYRVGVIVAIVWLVRKQQVQLRFDTDRPIRVEEVHAFFPAATRLEPDASERAGLWVLDAKGNAIGYVLRTSPMSDKIVGYCGPTDTLVALTPDKANPKVVGIKVRSSLDTKQHVEDVIADESFMGTWDGKTWDEVAGMDPRAAGIEGVSGASLTSRAIANGIRHRFAASNEAAAAQVKASHEPMRASGRDIGLFIVIALAFAFTFTHLRSRVWLRRAFQLVLIGYVGFFNGQILAQSLLAGWSASAVPWRAAPGLALLAAAALIVPWATRRQLYCSHLCPHGAAQEWAGRLGHRWTKRPVALPRGVDRGLRWLPPMLIGLVLFVTMEKVPFNLAGIEPFEAYLIRTAGAATIAVAVIGLVAATFVPMAYCKYGCPTGMVLSFIRSHGKADAFGRRDLVAGLLVLLSLGLYTWHAPIHRFLIR